MTWFMARRGSGQRVAIGFREQGLIYATGVARAAATDLLDCGFLPSSKDSQQSVLLDRLCQEHGLKGASAVVVLEPGSYNLLQMEAPEVEPEEMNNAMRWRIKDLIDFHIDDAVLDLFEMPQTRRQNTTRMVTVVAARRSLLQQQVDWVESAGLEMEAIDISELAVRNLMLNDTQGLESGALLSLTPTYGYIEVLHQGDLYLQRRIEIGDDDLVSAGGDELLELQEALVLELQRSLDYFDSQYAAGPVQKIALHASEAVLQPLMQVFVESFRSDVTAFDPLAGFNSSRLQGDRPLNRLLPVLGALQRRPA